jgi:tRNA pseudouridine13 synthase
MKLNFDWNELPLVSSDLLGTGGRIRSELEDFQVTEVAAYPFDGEGEHLYLWLEKRGHTTKWILETIQKQMGIKPRDIGVAGLKDRHAITRQWISIPRKFEDRLPSLNLEGLSLLETKYHSNKLGIGHLRGNVFKLRVRGIDPNSISDVMARARAILDRLEVMGVPNYFGPQRFGNTGENAVRGLELVRNGRMRGPESIPLKRFLIGSLQSLLFNHYTRLRLERGFYDALLEGDVAKKHDTGGMFTVADAVLESPRAARLEVSATGPLHGKKVMPAHGPSKALEDEVLTAFELDNAAFKDRAGSRRITRIKMDGLKLEACEDGFWLEFALPKGSFATVVLREVMKVNVDGLDGPLDEGSSEDEG